MGRRPAAGQTDEVQAADYNCGNAYDYPNGMRLARAECVVKVQNKRKAYGEGQKPYPSPFEFIAANVWHAIFHGGLARR